MKKVLWTAYGSPEVLLLGETERPSPKDDQILVKIIATSVFTGDCELRSFKMHSLYWLPVRLAFGIFKPRGATLGQELAGEVVEVGKDVTGFKPGDQIFSPTEMGGSGGSYCEYICLTGKFAAIKPANMSYQEAAAVPTGGLNALHFIRRSELKKGQKVLLYGAGGCIGTFAIQLAKEIGAEVTVVDSTDKLAVLRSIGADHVIDYTQEDFTENEEVYDVIIDIVGKSPFSKSLKSIKDEGRYILGNANTKDMIRALWAAVSSRKKVNVVLTDYCSEDLDYLRELIEAGKIKTVIDRSYPLEQIVDAHHYVDTGQKIGHVVINVA